MNKIITILISINFCFCIGVKALHVPQTATLLGCANTGVAFQAELNPANLFIKNSHLSFSNNDWLVDTRGQKISVLFTSKNKTHSYFSLESLNNKNIELRSDVPSDAPVGYFDVYWYGFDFAQSFNARGLLHNSKLFSNMNIGYKIKFNISKLGTFQTYGYLFDFGINKQINNVLNFGVVMKNFGKQYSDNLKFDDEKMYGIGVNYYIDKIKLNLFTDLIYYNDTIIKNISVKTNMKYFNIMFGNSKSSHHNQVSCGLSIKIGDWDLVYGMLENLDSSFENPVSIELKKYF